MKNYMNIDDLRSMFCSVAEEMEKTGADILQFNTTVIAEDVKDPRRVEYLKKLLTPAMLSTAAARWLSP